MAITRYTARRPTLSPWFDLDLFGNRLNRMFEDLPAGETGAMSALVPAVNVEENADALVLTAELPGMRQEDINIEFENNVLTISGEKVDTREEDNDRRYHVWERRYGSFQRSFTLPRTVSADTITADFHNGVLSIRMPKMEEAKGRRIAIGGTSAKS